MKLTRAERWILSNQMEILARLSDDPRERDTLRRKKWGIDQGYEGAYELFCEHIDDEGVDATVCNEAEQILAMYSYLSWAHEQAPNPTKMLAEYIPFPGFGPSERSHAAYAYFLCDFLYPPQPRYTRVDRGPSGDFRGQTNLLDRYRRMLEVYQNLDLRGSTSPESNLAAIIAAGWGYR